MISYFQPDNQRIIAVDSKSELSEDTISKLSWLFGNAELVENMGIKGIVRIEEFFRVASKDAPYDPMLQNRYKDLDQSVFAIDRKPEPLKYVDDIETYNQQEGLALSEEEMEYLKGISAKIGRKLTDSEVYGFAQVNSEHCRHKIFNGTFIIDGKKMPNTLFALIKKSLKIRINSWSCASSEETAASTLLT